MGSRHLHVSVAQNILNDVLLCADSVEVRSETPAEAVPTMPFYTIAMLFEVRCNDPLSKVGEV